MLPSGNSESSVTLLTRGSIDLKSLVRELSEYVLAFGLAMCSFRELNTGSGNVSIVNNGESSC